MTQAAGDSGSPEWITDDVEIRAPVRDQPCWSRRKAGAVPPRKALEYAAGIASGLSVAHDKGIVHQDLKPATNTNPSSVARQLPYPELTHKWPQHGRRKHDHNPTWLE